MNMKCKQCGLNVTWRKVDGKKQCFDASTDTVHWDRCSAERFAKIKATGKRFETETEAGYFTALKKCGVQYTKLMAPEIVGEDYRVSGRCKNCVPPWEVCPNGCPDAL